MSQKIKVLHVTEAFGGGVTSAINTYVEHSMQFDHYLFASIREGDETGEESTGRFSEVTLAPRSFSALFAFYKFLRRINPDVIHLHSTYAGFFVRLLPFVKRNKIVYTPHAFAFLREDANWKLKIYYIIEWLLAKRTQIIAGCGKDEANIARRFKSNSGVSELINVCGSLPPLSRTSKASGSIVVSMIGRVCAQKGYDFYGEVAAIVGSRAKFVWIGGGDAQGVDKLTADGVAVTGWLDRKSALECLSDSDIYFHSAAWDGFPISVLEVAQYEVPMVLRNIGPFSAEGLSVVNSVEDASQKILSYISGDEAVVQELNLNSRMVSEYHTSTNLSNALDQLYSLFGE